MTSPTSDSRDAVRRWLRILAILEAADDVALSPLSLLDLHNVGYFADALAPVWGVDIVEAQMIKRVDGPMSHALQASVDHLVGKGLVVPEAVGHVETAEGGWRLDASYRLNRQLTQPILEEAQRHHRWESEVALVREVVYALSALGEIRPATASREDAAYADPVVDVGGLLDLTAAAELNKTARVALRFDTLLEDTQLTQAEMVHMYIRALYERLVAA